MNVHVNKQNMSDRVKQSVVDLHVTPGGNFVHLVGLGCHEQVGAICGYASVMNLRAAMLGIAAGRTAVQIVEHLPATRDIIQIMRNFQMHDSRKKDQALLALREKYGDLTELIKPVGRGKGRISKEELIRQKVLLGVNEVDYENIRSLSAPQSEWSTREDLHRFNLYVERAVNHENPRTITEPSSFDGRSIEYVDYSVEKDGGITYMCTTAVPEGVAVSDDNLERYRCSRIAFLKGARVPIIRRRNDLFGGMELTPSLVVPYLKKNKYLAWISPKDSHGTNHWKSIILFLTKGDTKVTVNQAHISKFKKSHPDMLRTLTVGDKPKDGPAGFSLTVYILDSQSKGVCDLHTDDITFINYLLDTDNTLYGTDEDLLYAGRACPSPAHAGITGGAGGPSRGGGHFDTFHDGVLAGFEGLSVGGGDGGADEFSFEWECLLCGAPNVANESNNFSTTCRKCGRTTAGGRRRLNQRHAAFNLRSKRLYY